MKKASKRSPLSEFSVSIFQRGSPHAVIWFNGLGIGLRLNRTQWKRLVAFLKATLNRRRLPKGRIAYAEFDIHTNYYRYHENEKEPRTLIRILRPYGMKEERVRQLKHEYRIRAKSYGRHLLGDPVYLRTKEVVLALEREKFKRLRTVCLKPANFKEHR